MNRDHVFSVDCTTSNRPLVETSYFSSSVVHNFVGVSFQVFNLFLVQGGAFNIESSLGLDEGG